MRKLFRFKYEPCNKTCYCYCSKLMTELRKLEQEDRQGLVASMVRAHNKLCDNPDYSFGVDMDDTDNVFVAHFRTPEKTDVFYNKHFAGCVMEVCNEVMKEKIPQLSGECRFGDNGSENLGKQILDFCEDVAYYKLLEEHCECKS